MTERTIHTEGGAYIEQGVHTGGDFVARDQIKYEATVIVTSPEDANRIVAEQARKAALLAGTFTRLPFEPECVMISSDFHIGKYPVTNAQYAAFLSENSAQPAPRSVGWFLNQPPAHKVDHPVVGVSWHEAVAYCAWLSEATGRPYRLPSQTEWERAARGPEAYRYPWGNEWQENAANVDSQDTTSITAYPDGASPYGCQDMLGNVQEWTATHRVRDDYIHCGGYYSNTAQELHCGLHDTSHADTQVPWRGFRILLALRLPSGENP